MSGDGNEFDRLVSGRPSSDDAAVSAFLDELRSAFPPASTAGFEAEHLAAVARESRIVAAAGDRAGTNLLGMRRTRFRRALVSSMAGAAVLLTAGVGAAAAMGINPIAQLVAPRIPQPPITSAPAQPSVGVPPATDAGRPQTPPVPPVSVPPATSTDGPTASESPKPVKTEKTDKTKKAKKEKKAKKDKKDKSDKTNKGSGKNNKGGSGQTPDDKSTAP